MFVIDKLKQDLKERQDAWERARDKWVLEGKYRYHSDYEDRFPKPGHYFRFAFRGLLIGSIISVLILLMVGFINEQKEANKNKTTETSEAEEKDCKSFNKDDYVRIQYGDYSDLTGNIVGGCEPRESYQVRLSEGQKAWVRNDGIRDKVDVGDRIIGVNTYKNLVVVEEPEEE